MLKGYLDASTREDSGLLSVAIYLFESQQVRRFRREWRRSFGETKFSWADLIACHGQFEHLRGADCNPIRKAHDPLVAAGVSTVREHTIAGSIVSCWKQDVANFGPIWIKGFGHPYSIAGHMAMTGIGSWAKRNGYRGGITYEIEAGDDGYDQLEQLLVYASKVNEIADLYQWKGHGTAPKTAASPFHAPDLLAWEWGKYWQESVIEKRRTMRRSLWHLLNDRVDRYSFQHLSGPPLLKFFSGIHALGVEQLEEARAELSPTSSVDVIEALRSSEQTVP